MNQSVSQKRQLAQPPLLLSSKKARRSIQGSVCTLPQMITHHPAPLRYYPYCSGISIDELFAVSGLISLSPITKTQQQTKNSLTNSTIRSSRFLPSSKHIFQRQASTQNTPTHCTSQNLPLRTSSVMTPKRTIDTAVPINEDGHCFSLALPEDDMILSPLQCLIRRHCVEAFSATEEHVAHSIENGNKVVELGQIGTRCIYCKHLPTRRRPDLDVCFPSSVQNIYHSIETWQKYHSLICPKISPWVRKSICDLQSLNSFTVSGGDVTEKKRRDYWKDSARKLGMVDTPYGIQLISPKLPDCRRAAQPVTPERNQRMTTKSTGHSSRFLEAAVAA